MPTTFFFQVSIGIKVREQAGSVMSSNNDMWRRTDNL